MYLLYLPHLPTRTESRNRFIASHGSKICPRGREERRGSRIVVPLMLLWAMIAAGGGGGRLLAEEQRFSATEVHMGTEFHITCYAHQPDQATRAMREAFARIAELDRCLSDYDSASELSRLALSSPHEKWQQVSPDLWNVMVEADQFSRWSHGAFDITVGPLARVWRRARRRQTAPTEEVIQQARAAVGWQLIEFRPPDDSKSPRQVRLLGTDMRLDVGGIAKGYAVEEALRTLERWGVARALVNGGGDLAAGAAPPGESGWRIGVAALRADAGPSRFLRVAHRSVATSGDFWQFLEIDGQRYSHILDPRTGYGITDRSSVTVIARRGSFADAFASTVSVVGPKRGLELAAQWDDVELLILTEMAEDSSKGEPAESASRTQEKEGAGEPASGRVREWVTPGWARYLDGSSNGSSNGSNNGSSD